MNARSNFANAGLYKRSFFYSALALFTGISASCEQEIRANPIGCTPSMETRVIELPEEPTDVKSLLRHKEVVITFDDGPHAWRTQSVLNILDEYCLKATFFLQGSNTQRHPRIAAEIQSRGHSVGSHTFQHRNLTELSLEAALKEVQNGEDALTEALKNSPIKASPRLFRFPFVAATPELRNALYEQGFQIIDVQADGADWTRNSPEDSTQLILEKLSKHNERGIILLHDPFSKSDQRTEHLIKALIDRGYKLVHIV